MKGYFISFEGPDGSGKTTQINLLEKYFSDEGLEVVRTREPGGTKIAEAIREVILNPEYKSMSSIAEMYLYAAARAQHVSELIKPSLELGKIVLSDRFVDSSYAYQGYGRGLGMDMVEDINRIAMQGVEPDLTFFLDIDPSEGLKRSRLRGEIDRLEMETLNFHIKVYEGFKSLCDRYPNRFKVIDANRSIEEIHKEIIIIIQNLPKYGK